MKKSQHAQKKTLDEGILFMVIFLCQVREITSSDRLQERKILWKLAIADFIHAGVAELADALDLGSSALRRAGSIPVSRTIGYRGLQSFLWSLFPFYNR